VSVSASFPTLRFQNGLNQAAGATSEPEAEKRDESA